MRRALPSAVLFAACSGAPTEAPPPAAPPPNVLLITLDTLRVDALGVYGNRFNPSPNLDALAAQGVRFERAYTVTPLTIPAHSSIHTGLYPPRHGVRDNGDFFLSDDAVTLAERLSGEGYATMASVGAEVTSHHWGFAQGFDAYFDDLGPREAGGNRWRVERPGEEVVDDALGWLAEEREQPFFAWVHLFDVHDPYEAPAAFQAQLPGRPYLAEVAGVDHQVARLLAAIPEDTVVIAVADHGEGLGEHGESLHGMLLYDATTHIPLLLRAPGVAPAVVSTPVSLVDLAPTILGLTGSPAATVDGVDLAPHLRGEQPWPAERDIYLESLYASRHYGWAPQHALVDAEYKLIDSTTDKLFAATDGREEHNLADQPALLDPRLERLGTLLAGMDDGEVAQRVAADAGLADQLAALGYTTAIAPQVEGEAPDPEDNIGLLADMEGVRQAARSGDLQTLETLVAELLEADPGLVEPRISLATTLLSKGKPARAKEVADDVLAQQSSAIALVVAGSARVQLGEMQDGLATLHSAVAMDPTLAQAWVALLNGLLLSGDARGLREQSDAALHTLPEQPEVRALAAVGLALTNDTARAEPLLEQLLIDAPDTPMVRLGLGTVAQDAGRAEEAERLYREEMERFPPALPARRHLVALLAQQRQLEAQIAELLALQQLEPPSPLTWLSLAQARYNQGEHAQALDDVRRCVELAPALPDCALLEANALHKLGREEEAQAALARARALAGEGSP